MYFCREKGKEKENVKEMMATQGFNLIETIFYYQKLKRVNRGNEEDKIIKEVV